MPQSTTEAAAGPATGAGPTTVERIGFGIACAVAGMFGMAIMDTCAKLLGAGYAISQLVLVRNGIGAVAVLAFVLVSRGGLATLRPRQPVLLLLRTVTNIGAAFLFFSGLRYLPLADAFAIAFAAPLFVTGLSVPMLGEHVGLRRWAAVIVGFIGVLVVVQPGTDSFQPAALLPLGAALSYALAMLLGRKLTRSLSTPTIMFWPSLGAVLAMAVMIPPDWQTPTLPDTGTFLLMGIIGTLGAALITQGYRHAPAAVIAPFDYSVLLWGVIFGWLLWNDIPGPNVWIGASLLVASGLYILHRETRKPKPVQPVPGPMGPTS
ncbi:MAG: DMT family transporter [Kiloniellaceae bacterium]